MEETLLLKDLNCANCAAKIEDRIRKMDVVNLKRLWMTMVMITTTVARL